MVFLAEETIPVPAKDIVSWIFDDVPYDQDQPVSHRISHLLDSNGLDGFCAAAEYSNFEDVHRCCRPR